VICSLGKLEILDARLDALGSRLWRRLDRLSEQNVRIFMFADWGSSFIQPSKLSVAFSNFSSRKNSIAASLACSLYRSASNTGSAPITLTADVDTKRLILHWSGEV